ncbi:hypothetical protein BGW41_002994 [Actinomortierella wolfii]|nr:hypothetical protein BGW41_002994 [Actinomortierella wolfii]
MFWLPDGVTVDLVESELQKNGVKEMLDMPDPCKTAYMSNICASAYPRPVKAGENTYNVLFACKSACQEAVKSCTADFTFLNKTQNLPQCDTVPGTEKFGPIAYQNDGSCNSVSPLQPDFSCHGKPIENCPEPGCCLPCPQTEAFYKKGQLAMGLFITDVLKGVAAVGAFILVVSYLVLPDKRQHPSNLILFAAIATCLFAAMGFLSYGDPKRVQCMPNGVTPSTANSNIYCTIQGVWLIFSAISTTVWLTIIIVNLHLNTVWNSAWLSQHTWVAHILGWVFPAIFAIIGLVNKEYGWMNSNQCNLSESAVVPLLFAPLGIIVIPGTLLHFATFFHIIKVTLQSEASETLSRSTLSSGRAARISHRRHVMNAIRIQWRAAVLCLVVSCSVLLYWAFYVIENLDVQPGWMSTWQLCIFSYAGQDACTEYSRPHVPGLVMMIFAESLVSSTGLFIFLLFFKKTVVQEWWEFISGWACCGGRRKRDEDQFYVI